MSINKIFTITTGLCFVLISNLFAADNKTDTRKPEVIPDAFQIVDFLPVNNQEPHQTKTIQTDFFNIEFDSTGGVIRSMKHQDNENKLKNNVEMVTLEPFAFHAYLTQESSTLLKTSNFRLIQTIDKDFITIKATLPLLVKTKEGGIFPVNIIKTYKFDKKSHYWDFFWEIDNKSRKRLYIPEMYFVGLTDIGPYPKNISSTTTKNFKSFYYIDGKYNSVSIEASVGNSESSFFSCNKNQNIGDIEELSGKVEYFGMGSRFMIMAIQSLSTVNGITLVVDEHKKNEIHAHMGTLVVEPDQSAKYDFIIFSGPKVRKFFTNSPEQLLKNERLKKIHEKLYNAFDFGITAPIRDFIVVILKLLYKVSQNYGVAIILLVIGLKILFFPLNQAQAKSMLKMQILQPKLKEINEKYKNNPQEKQKRIMALYKAEKANPMGGCLPMVIQIPIIIALISAFSDSYELWGSPFIHGWINDLSEPDNIFTFSKNLPFIGGFQVNILPIIMLVSQFLQTHFTMVSVEKNQKIMMQVIPAVMVVMFWDFPSGVVLYWILFNLLSVLQQLYTNKFYVKKPA